jgi:hypothetical protein
MFVARRPFLHNGHTYKIGETVKGFPGSFEPRPEAFIRAGMIVEKKSTAKPKMQEVTPEG